MLFILAGSAQAQPSDGAEVYLGELDLLANINSTNSSLINSTLINSTAANNSTSIDVALALPQNLSASIGKEVLDLTSYARDRVNKSLAGYTNIMYPITGSRGPQPLPQEEEAVEVDAAAVSFPRVNFCDVYIFCIDTGLRTPLFVPLSRSQSPPSRSSRA